MTPRRWIEGLAAALAILAAAAYIGRLTSPPAEESVRRPDAGAAGPARPATTRPLRIGWTAWADAEWITHLVARILESRLDQPVELVMADIGLQYQGLANGDLDVMLMAWLPVTHRDYYDRVAGRVTDLGPIYTRARLGWLVPSYVSEDELGSIEDLHDADVRRRLGGRIHGIDPGSGLMRASRQALVAYGLSGDWELLPASAAAMAAALDRAVRRERWVVVTGWSPHWIFARFDLRYLRDPLGMLGSQERVHALARSDLDTEFPPRVLEFLARLYVPIEAVEQALLVANESSLDDAVDDFLSRESRRVEYWVTGRAAD